MHTPAALTRLSVLPYDPAWKYILSQAAIHAICTAQCLKLALELPSPALKGFHVCLPACTLRITTFAQGFTGVQCCGCCALLSAKRYTSLPLSGCLGPRLTANIAAAGEAFTTGETQKPPPLSGQLQGTML